MLLYRLGRLLQVLALIDAAFALFFGGAIPKIAGMDPQFQIILLAAVLFGAGRLLQRAGEKKLRAGGVIPGEPGPGGDDSASSPGPGER